MPNIVPAAMLPHLPSAMTRIGVALRVEGPDDHAVARMLYGAARADELARVAWPSAMMTVFLDAQFAAQSAHYAVNHPVADRWIVTRLDVPVGRLYVDRSGANWHLLDIVIAHEARGLGIGTALVTALVRAARRAHTRVTLQVARDNSRAEALYRHLGFAETPSESVTHKAMTHSGKARHR